MKIGFTTDTNFFGLKNQDSYKKTTFLDEMDYFIDYIFSLNETKPKYELEYCVPDLVFEELYNQKKASFKNSYDAFEKKYNLLSYGLLGDLPKFNLDEVLLKEMNEYKEKVITLTSDYNQDLFLEIIKDSLEKNPPFDKNLPNTGFKDSLIWKTIVYSEYINKYDEFYLFSGDKIFKDNEEFLTAEFSKHHPNVNLFIVFLEPNGNQRQNAFNAIIEKYKLYKTDVVKLYNSNVILKYIKSLILPANVDSSYYMGNGIEVNLEDVLFKDFDETDFYIDKVIKEGNGYNVDIVFRTKKYITDIIIEENEKKYLLGNVRLQLNETKNSYICKSSEIYGVDFDLGVVDLLRGFTIKGVGNLASEISKIVNENYRINMECLQPLKELQETIKKITEPIQNTQKMYEALNLLKDIKIASPIDSMKPIGNAFNNENKI